MVWVATLFSTHTKMIVCFVGAWPPQCVSLGMPPRQTRVAEHHPKAFMEPWHWPCNEIRHAKLEKNLIVAWQGHAECLCKPGQLLSSAINRSWGTLTFSIMPSVWRTNKTTIVAEPSTTSNYGPLGPQHQFKWNKPKKACSKHPFFLFEEPRDPVGVPWSPESFI